MSELSPVYTEYEKISDLFRRLNEATLMARQTMLGLKETTAQEEKEITHDLEEALSQISGENKSIEEFDDSGIPNHTFLELLQQLKYDSVTETSIERVRHRVKRGLKALSDDDLEIIEKVTEALDSTSEKLFRRIHK